MSMQIYIFLIVLDESSNQFNVTPSFSSMCYKHAGKPACYFFINGLLTTQDGGLINVAL